MITKVSASLSLLAGTSPVELMPFLTQQNVSQHAQVLTTILKLSAKMKLVAQMLLPLS
jgi:hypothetical protein